MDFKSDDPTFKSWHHFSAFRKLLDFLELPFAQKENYHFNFMIYFDNYIKNETIQMENLAYNRCPTNAAYLLSSHTFKDKLNLSY